MYATILDDPKEKCGVHLAETASLEISKKLYSVAYQWFVLPFSGGGPMIISFELLTI